MPPGSDLFSHALASTVSSALGRFTTVFGMGTGGSTPLQPPGGIFSITGAHHIAKALNHGNPANSVRLKYMN